MSKNDENISSEDHIFDRNEKYIDELQSFLFTDWKKKNEKIKRIVETGNFSASKDTVPWYIILPFQQSKRIWDIFVCLCCIISLILITIDISWNSECITNDKGQLIQKLYNFFTTVFFLDIGSSFITAKLDERNNYIYNLKDIFLEYLYNELILDIISCFPYNNLFTFDMAHCYKPYIPYNKIFYFLFFFRISRINKFFNLLEREFSKYTNFIRLIKLFSIIIFISNSAGNLFCGNSITVIDSWVFNECRDQYPRSSPEYISCNIKVATEKPEVIYFYSLFLGIIMTLGTDFQVRTTTELIMLSVIFVLSTIINASIYGNVAVMLSKVSYGVSPILMSKIDTMQEYMRFKNFNKEFISKIEEYHLNIWYKQRNMMYDPEFFNDMSSSLHKILLLQQWKKTFFRYCKLFPFVSENFVLDMVVLLKPKIFMTYDIVITEGEYNTEVYLTSSNCLCKVFIGGQWVKDITKGDFFGEVAIFLRSRRRSATIISNSNSDFLFLDGKNFEILLRNYPEDYEKIKKNAIKTFIDTMKFYPASLFAKLVPNNNLKDYLFRKKIYLNDEEEESILNYENFPKIEKADYEMKINSIRDKLKGIKDNLDKLVTKC